jgi:hypothetical protein
MPISYEQQLFEGVNPEVIVEAAVFKHGYPL